MFYHLPCVRFTFYTLIHYYIKYFILISNRKSSCKRFFKTVQLIRGIVLSYILVGKIYSAQYDDLLCNESNWKIVRSCLKRRRSFVIRYAPSILLLYMPLYYKIVESQSIIIVIRFTITRLCKRSRDEDI